MPLEISATAGASDANAYVDRETAVEMARYRIGGSSFVDLSDDEQVQALVSAARALDAVPWKGERVDDVQALEFPRTDFSLPIPKWLVAANVELAISYAPAFTAGAEDPLDPSSQRLIKLVKKVDAGPVKVEFRENAADATLGDLDSILSHFPLIVRGLIAPHVYVEPGATWGMSTSVRTA